MDMNKILHLDWHICIYKS